MMNKNIALAVLALSFCYFAYEIAHVLHDVASDCVVYKAGMVDECK